MPGCHAVGAERVSRFIDVVVGINLPVGRVVFRNAPAVFTGPVVGKLEDAGCALHQHRVAKDVPRSHQRFNSVHVGVDAAVVFTFREGTIPGFGHQPRFRVEPVLFLLGEGILQKRTSITISGGKSRSGSEDHERLCVRFLSVIDRHPVSVLGRSCHDRRVPSAINRVVEVVLQRVHPVRDEFLSAGYPVHLREGEDVRHPCRNPQLNGAFEVDPAALIHRTESRWNF